MFMEDSFGDPSESQVSCSSEASETEGSFLVGVKLDVVGASERLSLSYSKSLSGCTADML